MRVQRQNCIGEQPCCGTGFPRTLAEMSESPDADAELMRYLAKLGADPNIPNADNATPLMAAAGLGTRSPGEDAGTEDEVVEALQVALDLGNDINAVDNNGETAMHGAAYKNSPKAVEFLAANEVQAANRLLHAGANDRLGLLTQADQGGDRAPRDPGEVVDNPWAIGHARSPVGLAVPSPYNPTP